MDTTQKTKYFFGSNTPLGFTGAYEHLLSDKLIILKGGAGTGKSTLISKIATEAQTRGMPYELYYCSSDADSLDAVSIPTLSTTVCDGTAPHVIEATLPAYKHYLFNLSEMAKGNIISPYDCTIKNCIKYKKQYFTNAYSYLKCAYSLQSNLDTSLVNIVDFKKLNLIADDIMDIIRFEYESVYSTKFASAFSDKGLVDFLPENSGDSIKIAYETEFDVVGIWLIRRLKMLLDLNKINYTAFINPFYAPSADALKIGRYVIASKGRLPDATTQFNLDFCVRQFNRHFVATDIPLIEKLVALAIQNVNFAKLTHKETEKIYSPAMDWAHVNDITARIFDVVFN